MSLICTGLSLMIVKKKLSSIYSVVEKISHSLGMYLPSGRLMYVDSIYAKTFKEVAKLVSPMTTVPMSGCLSFQYQRSERRGNIFSVFTRDRLGQYQELWKAENQSDWSETLGEWTPVQVDLKAPYSVQVNINIQTASHLSLS